MQKLRLTDFASYKSLSALALSPDGKKAAFTAHQADLENDAYTSDIFVYRLDSQSISRLTNTGQVAAFDWLNDSEHTVHIETQSSESSVAQRTEVYETNIDNGTVRQAGTIPGYATAIKAVGQRRFLYTVEVNLAPSTISDDVPDCDVIDELPFCRDGEGFTNKQRVHLHLFNMDTESIEELAGGFLHVQAFDVRGDLVAIVGNQYESVAPIRNDIYLLDLTDRTLRRLTNRSHLFEAPCLVTDEVIMVLGSDISRCGFRQNKEVYALHLDSGQLESLTPGWDRSVRQHSVSTDIRMGQSAISRAAGDRYFCIATKGYSANLYAVDLNGGITALIEEPGAVDDFDVKGDTIAYVAMRDIQLQELYTFQDGAEQQLTTLNTDVLADKTISIPEHFTVQTTPGTEIDAWFLKPAQYEDGQSYPAVLEIHGGPKVAASGIFQHELQLLANEGYAVFYCNPRGSDGRGDDFHNVIRGNFGTFDYEDIMAVVDYVLERYDFVDPDRLGVTGLSYGGFMTNWIIGHTNIFKAAVSAGSIANWSSFVGTNEFGYFWAEDYLTVSVWEDMERYWFHSPLRYADHVETPTLFLHADEDYECALSQALEMFTALRHFGVETRLCIFEGESHRLVSVGKPRSRVRYWREMVDWFDKYLKG